MDKVQNIKLQKKSNFKDIEKLGQEILNSGDTKLQIPNALSYSGGFGIEASALQLLATWLRSSSSQILHTSILNAEDPASFESLCNSLFGLCALRLSKEIWAAKKTKIELSIALKPALPIVENIRSHNFKDAKGCI